MYAFKRNYYLKHHGVQGQKWGVKNGPPYPLDSSKSTGKRLKTNKGTVKTGQSKKESIIDKIKRKSQEKKRLKEEELKKKFIQNVDEESKIKPDADGYEKDEYGWLNKNVEVKDSRGKKVNVLTMIDTEIYDKDSQSYRQKTESETKEIKKMLSDVVKDFQTYDKIAREYAAEDMRDYLPGWGDGNIAPESFMKRLKDPAIRITDNLSTAVIEYTSPDTWHWHSVAIDIKKKKPKYASMDG